MAQVHIEHCGVKDVDSDTDDWPACMNGMGINAKLQTAIMLPKFKDLRFTATCKHWVLEAVEVAYLTLSELDDQARNDMRAKTPQHAAPHSRKGFEMRLRGGGSPDPHAIVDAKKPGHTMLWRGGYKEKELGLENEDGTLDLTKLATCSGDFSGGKKLAYFTPQPETADGYAQWAKHKVEAAEVCVTQVAVPESLTKDLETLVLWSPVTDLPSDDWKQMIWSSRRSGRWPQPLRKKWGNVGLIQGHIASSIDKTFIDMRDWNELRANDVMKINVKVPDGTWERWSAMQWVFYSTAAQEAFEEACQGQVTFHEMGAFKVPKQSDD